MALQVVLPSKASFRAAIGAAAASVVAVEPSSIVPGLMPYKVLLKRECD